MRKLRQRKTISVAAVQPAIVEEIDAQRLARVERLLAKVEKADLVTLPELWRVGYSNFASYLKKAEPIYHTSCLMTSWHRSTSSGKCFASRFFFKLFFAIQRRSLSSDAVSFRSAWNPSSGSAAAITLNV